MYNEAMTITKVKNIYIMLLNSISTGNINKVDHYLDDNLTQYFKKVIEDNTKNNLIQKYDQLNITNVEIIKEDDQTLTISATVKYMDYKIDAKTKKIVNGNNKKRIVNYVLLGFRKNKKRDTSIYRCPNCNAGLNINNSSICTYCGSNVDERYSEYVLCSIN